MTKQDIIRSLKKDLEGLKMMFLVVLTLATLFGALVGTYKGCVYISNAVSKALEPTAEEMKAAEEKAAEDKLLNELIEDCERRCPVGMHARARASFCYEQSMLKTKKLLKKQKKKKR